MSIPWSVSIHVQSIWRTFWRRLVQTTAKRMSFWDKLHFYSWTDCISSQGCRTCKGRKTTARPKWSQHPTHATRCSDESDGRMLKILIVEGFAEITKESKVDAQNHHRWRFTEITKAWKVDAQKSSLLKGCRNHQFSDEGSRQQSLRNFYQIDQTGRNPRSVFKVHWMVCRHLKFPTFHQWLINVHLEPQFPTLSKTASNLGNSVWM